MASKQTAVEWLVEQLEQHYTSIDIKNTVVFQQAKAMEKQQIIDAYDEGYGIRDAYGDCSDNQTPEQFYASTYNL